jgi:8-oxo-dGTP diphosphatase
MDWSTWQPNMQATLMFVIRDGRILLIRKKRGLGAGKINGPGGKIEPGETAAEAVLRETEEELGIRPIRSRELGILHFQFTDGLAIRCHVFRADDFTGIVTETDEAVPLWTPLDSIPLDEMWADDRYWLPHVLADRSFMAYFEFDGETMLSRRVEPEAEVG